MVTAPVGTDDFGTEVRSIGTAAAARSVTLYSQVAGIVESIDFTPGSEVSGGQILLRLDSADQQVALDRANIALEAARETLDRAERLEKTGNVTASEKVDIRDNGSVDGDVTAPRVAIAEGAHFRGAIDMQQKSAPKPAVKDVAAAVPAKAGV